MNNVPLPRDIICIIDDYSKDTTYYEKVLDELERRSIDARHIAGFSKNNNVYLKLYHHRKSENKCRCGKGLNLKLIQGNDKCFQFHSELQDLVDKDKKMNRCYLFEMFSYLQFKLKELSFYKHDNLFEI